MPGIKSTMGVKVWTMLLVLGAVWGGSFFLFEIALEGLPTFTIAFLRVLGAAATLWVMLLALRYSIPTDPRLWGQFAVMGFLNNALPFSLVIWGQIHIDSGLSAILTATTPFFGVLVANRLTSDEKLTPMRLAGTVAGLAGVAAMVGINVLEHLGANLWGQLAVVAAAVSYAFSSVYGRRFAGVPPLITAAGQTTGSSLLLLPLVLLVERPWTLTDVPAQSWWAVLVLATVCTAFAYVLYFAILRSAGATNVVLVTFLCPISAILLGTLVLGEPLLPHHLLGMAAIGIGLALIDGRLPRMLAGPRTARGSGSA